MQIAKIVPDIKTRDEGVFDYAIPPELLPDIQLGILVEIPFHGRKIEGIVIDIKRTSSIPNLKFIIKVIDSNPVIDDIHIKLSKWMSDYYLEPFSKCLFENIVPVARRSINKKEAWPNNTPRGVLFGENKSVKLLVIASFQKRLETYQKAISKMMARNKQTVILVPDLTTISYFTHYLTSAISIIHSGLTHTQRYLEWQKIREGKAKIVIGSNSALFAPVKNLGLIIIDQEENETYKNGQSPRFHAVKVSEKLCELSGANLILGSISPRVVTYYNALKDKYRIIKIPFLRSSGNKGLENTIVDMNFEKGIISQPLRDKIDEVLKNRKKIMLVLNRKGEGTKFSCADCGWIALCEKCGLPLIPQKAENVCYNCEKNFSLPTVCPKCRGINLKAYGVGTKRLAKFAQDFWPKAKIIIIDKESGITKDSFDIAIVTSFALKFSMPKIALTGIIDADQSMNFPDFHSPEKTFANFYKFLKIGEKGILQTHLPQNFVFSALAGMNYEKFFLSELENRRKSSFPPFVKITRLLFRNIDESICRRELDKVFRSLITHHSSLITFLGPSPCFIKKERNKYRYQIVLKHKTSLPEDVIDTIRSLPKGWIVDVDPVDLL